MKTSLGMISNTIVDKMGSADFDDVDEDLHKAMLNNTKKVADHFSAGIVELSNRLNNHLILT